MLDRLKSILLQARSAHSRGEAADSERLYKEAAAEAEATEAAERAEALNGIAQARRDRGDHTGAAIYYAEAITLLRNANLSVPLAFALRHSADVRSELGEFGVAGTQIQEAIRLYRYILLSGPENDPISPELNLANALRVQALNDERQATASWHEAAILYSSANMPDAVEECHQHLHTLNADSPSSGAIAPVQKQSSNIPQESLA